MKRWDVSIISNNWKFRHLALILIKKHCVFDSFRLIGSKKSLRLLPWMLAKRCLLYQFQRSRNGWASTLLCPFRPCELPNPVNSTLLNPTFSFSFWINPYLSPYYPYCIPTVHCSTKTITSTNIAIFQATCGGKISTSRDSFWKSAQSYWTCMHLRLICIFSYFKDSQYIIDGPKHIFRWIEESADYIYLKYYVLLNPSFSFFILLYHVCLLIGFRGSLSIILWRNSMASFVRNWRNLELHQAQTA